MAADHQAHLDILEEAMREAALELAMAVGVEDVTAPIVDSDQVPAAAWRAATNALQFLLAGLGTIGEEPTPLGDEELAILLDPERGPNHA